VQELSNKIQESRLQLSGYDAFKQRKQQERILTPKEEKTLPGDQTQTEIAYEEPPSAEALVNEPAVDADAVQTLWLEFSKQTGVRISSLMKAIVPAIDGKDVVVQAASAAQMDALDEVRFEFNRFVTVQTSGKLTNLRIEKGATSVVDRKPYTDKEKLEFIIKKTPQWQEVIEKLGLRLP
jgi:hypothetical protein